MPLRLGMAYEELALTQITIEQHKIYFLPYSATFIFPFASRHPGVRLYVYVTSS